MTPPTIGSLFSGIGGLDLGLERGIGNGARTIWQVEQNAYCRAVLAKHWPDATRYEDVRNVGRANLAPVDVICGGFPCQDISQAGLRGGIRRGNRSGLWYEFVRIVGELRPRYVVVENVARLLADGMDIVLGELAAVGYDAEWSVVSACSVGASHVRRRVFILAYPASGGLEGRSNTDRMHGSASGQRRGQPARSGAGGREGIRRWAAESSVQRVADGVPARMDRLIAIGNAVVPEVAEVPGRLIAEREALAVAA